MCLILPENEIQIRVHTYLTISWLYKMQLETIGTLSWTIGDLLWTKRYCAYVADKGLALSIYSQTVA